jgi:hypothetical protein
VKVAAKDQARAYDLARSVHMNDQIAQRRIVDDAFREYGGVDRLLRALGGELAAEIGAVEGERAALGVLQDRAELFATADQMPVELARRGIGSR